MSSQHTPGPWLIVRYANGFSITSQSEPEYGCIAERWESTEREPTRLANAHLIAAAPDLLAETRNRSQALGVVKVLLLQNDIAGALDVLGQYDLVFMNGPIMTSPALAKAEGK